jgi:hypothetical protein
MAVLFFVGPAIAKTGFVARLDSTLPVDPPPGSTVQVGWTLIDPRSDGVLQGVTTFLRIHPLGGPAFEVAGREDAAGHYTASFEAPLGGIVLVDFGMLGENCENGTCTRSDVMFPVDEPEAPTRIEGGVGHAGGRHPDARRCCSRSSRPSACLLGRPASAGLVDVESSANRLALVVLAVALVAAMIFAARRVLRRT